MGFSLLHLSDIHFLTDESANPIMKRVDAIMVSLASVTSTLSDIIIAISGDIAFSGAKTEYKNASEFLDELTNRIKERFSPKTFHIVAVPGNHDCDFSENNSARDILVERITRDQLDETIFEICLQPQSNYFDFSEEFSNGSPNLSTIEKIFSKIDLQLSSNKVRFQLLNTAYMSSKNEGQGKLIFPEDLFEGENEDFKDDDLVITMMHHPYNWISSSNLVPLRENIDASSDLVLTGHMHEGDHYRKECHSGAEIGYLEGGVLQDTNDTHVSSFTIVSSHQDSQDLYMHPFEWDRSGGYQEIYDPIDLTFQRNNYRLRKNFVLSKEGSDFLSDPGATFSHPAKEHLSLDDIYVYPDLQVLNIPGEKDQFSSVVRKEIPYFIMQEKKLLIVGSHKSGKTALCKSIYKDLRASGFVPLYISGEILKSSKSEKLKTLLQNRFEKQYRSPGFENYWALDPSDKALIIDNFQATKLNATGRDLLLDFLNEHFEIIVLFANEQIRYGDLFSEARLEGNIWKLSHCSILPFGHLRRSYIIEKWVSLGRNLSLEKEELTHRIRHAETLISTLLGKNLVPPYPLFVLTILQQIEVATPLETTASSGSFAYIYEVLLRMALSAAAKEGDDLDTQHSYLASLAFKLFDDRTYLFSNQNLVEFHNDYCRDYQIELDFLKFIETLVKASVLRVQDGGYSFGYPYIYYYFVALYMRDNLDNEEIRHLIEDLAKRLHHTESANILLFVSYLSRSDFLHSSIKNAADNLYSQYAECNILKDTSFMKTLIEDIPELVLDASDPDQARKDYLARIDEIEQENDNENVPFSSKAIAEISIDDELDEFLKINVAFKTIQILGQIIRNHAGSLKREIKLAITRSAIGLSLRVLSFMLVTAEKQQEDLIEFLADIVKSHNPIMTSDQLADGVKELFFHLMERFSYVTIKQVSDAFGDKRLALTFDEVVKESNNTSYDYVDLSIRIDSYPGFPELETLNLFKKVHKDFFSAQVLRLMVWNYFYLYPAGYKVREAVCKRLGIKLLPYVIHDHRPKLLGK